MRIWRILNSRFIASLCAVVVLIGAAWVGLGALSGLSLFNNDDFQRVDTLAHLQLLSFAEIPTSEDRAQKFVGRVRNNSTNLVTSITGAVGFYDDTKTLKDLFTERLDAISLLKPGEEADFVIVRHEGRESANAKPTKTNAPHTELRFVDVSITRENP